MQFYVERKMEAIVTSGIMLTENSVKMLKPSPKAPSGLARCCLAALFCLAWLPNQALAAASPLQPSELRCEYLKDPMGIDVLQPRLSWIAQTRKENLRAQQQVAYQVIVASTAKALRSNDGDLWDSGKVTTNRSLHIRYAGEPLLSHQECFWKVRIWDQDGKSLRLE